MCFRHCELLGKGAGTYHKFIPSIEHSAWYRTANQGVLAAFNQNEIFEVLSAFSLEEGN